MKPETAVLNQHCILEAHLIGRQLSIMCDEQGRGYFRQASCSLKRRLPLPRPMLLSFRWQFGCQPSRFSIKPRRRRNQRPVDYHLRVLLAI